MRLWNSPKSGKFQYEGMRKGVSGDNWFFTQQRDNATLVDTVDPLLRSKKEIIRRSSRVQGSAKRCFLGCKQTATLFFADLCISIVARWLGLPSFLRHSDVENVPTMIVRQFVAELPH